MAADPRTRYDDDYLELKFSTLDAYRVQEHKEHEQVRRDIDKVRADMLEGFDAIRQHLADQETKRDAARTEANEKAVEVRRVARRDLLLALSVAAAFLGAIGGLLGVFLR